MPKCVFKYCRNITSWPYKKDGVSYFRFPRDPFSCAEWISVVAQQRCQEIYMPNNSSVVCSEHFPDTDMYDTDEGLQLNDGAVPCVDLPDGVSIFEIDSASSLKTKDQKNGAVADSSTAENGAMNTTEMTDTNDGAASMDVVNATELDDTKEVENTKKATQGLNTEVETRSVNAAEVVNDTIDLNMEIANPTEVDTGKPVNDPKYQVNAEMDALEEEPKKPFKSAMGPFNTMELVNIKVPDDRPVAAKPTQSEVLQTTVIEYRKKIIEKNDIINNLTKRNEKLHKRIESLRKELRSAHRRIERDTVIGQNLCKTLFFRYVRNYEHLYRQTGGVRGELSDDENES